MSAENHSGESFEAWIIEKEAPISVPEYEIARRAWRKAYQAGVLAGRLIVSDEEIKLTSKRCCTDPRDQYTWQQGALWLRDRLLGEKE
jgi:hypothetical protein